MYTGIVDCGAMLPDPRGVQELMLVNLDLDNNRIDSLNGALAGLGNLRILNLAGNRLEHLQVGDFDGMIRLDILDLTGNQLAELKPLEMVSYLLHVRITYIVH